MKKTLYKTISDKIAEQICVGKYPLNQPIPSIRKLAHDFSCTPSTVQRALNILNQKGLIYPKRTIGYYVTDNISTVLSFRKNNVQAYLCDFLSVMHSLGYTDTEILLLLKTYIKQLNTY